MNAILSPIVGIHNEAWTKFVRSLATQPLNSVSASNGLGMFAHRPRRLCDIGFMKNPTFFRAPSGRMVCRADFVSPMTDQIFLRDPNAQYEALRRSMLDYSQRISSGELRKPASMSLAGALGILHRGGPGALRGKRFPDTEVVFQMVKEAF